MSIRLVVMSCSCGPALGLPRSGGSLTELIFCSASSCAHDNLRSRQSQRSGKEAAFIESKCGHGYPDRKGDGVRSRACLPGFRLESAGFHPQFNDQVGERRAAFCNPARSPDKSCERREQRLPSAMRPTIRMKEAIKKRLGATRRYAGRNGLVGSITTFAVVWRPIEK
jgi:hypothetical protein